MLMNIILKLTTKQIISLFEEAIKNNIINKYIVLFRFVFF